MPDKKISVLFIDDEENNLTSFKASFRRDFNIYTTSKIAEARQILSDQEIHVLVTDQRMPEMSGVEFLESVIETHPSPIRILLTGFTDIEAVINAINKGQVYRYIMKPWNEDDLRQVINNAFEVYHTRQLLEAKNFELQKAYDELNRFVYSASHDLRAPLMSILGIIEVARMENEKIDNTYYEMIEKSVNKLDTFIQNIIDYYQNSKGGEQLVDINFKEVVEDTINNFEFLPNFSKIIFQVDIDQPSSFISDRFRIGVVLNNLLSNAIKYHDLSKPENTVTINVTCDDEKAILRIADNGIGIKQEHLDHIYEMFFRASHESAGSGIGLYIVKEAIDKLDGKIKANSEKDKGTCFEIEIANKS